MQGRSQPSAGDRESIRDQLRAEWRGLDLPWSGVHHVERVSDVNQVETGEAAIPDDVDGRGGAGGGYLLIDNQAGGMAWRRSGVWRTRANGLQRRLTRWSDRHSFLVRGRLQIWARSL